MSNTPVPTTPTPDFSKATLASAPVEAIPDFSKAELVQTPPVTPATPDFSWSKAIAGPETFLGSLADQTIQKLKSTVDEFEGKFRSIQAPADRKTVTDNFIKEMQNAPFQKPVINVSQFIDKAAHPIAKAVTEFGQGLTSPDNIAILVGTAGLGYVATPAKVALASRVISAGFSAQMIGEALKGSKPLQEAWEKGDAADVEYQLTHMTLNGALGVVTGAHAAGKPIPLMRPGGPTEAVVGKIGEGITAAREATANAAEAVAKNRESILAERLAGKKSVEAAKLDVKESLDKAHDLGILTDAEHENIKKADSATQAGLLHEKFHSDVVRVAGRDADILTTASEDGRDFLSKLSDLTEIERKDPAFEKMPNTSARVGDHLFKNLTSDSLELLRTNGHGEVAKAATDLVEDHIFREAEREDSPEGYLKELRKGYDQLHANGVDEEPGVKEHASTVYGLTKLASTVENLQTKFPQTDIVSKIVKSVVGGRDLKATVFSVLAVLTGHAQIGGVGGTYLAGKWLLQTTPAVRAIAVAARGLERIMRPEEKIPVPIEAAKPVEVPPIEVKPAEPTSVKPAEVSQEKAPAEAAPAQRAEVEAKVRTEIPPEMLNPDHAKMAEDASVDYKGTNEGQAYFNVREGPSKGSTFVLPEEGLTVEKIAARSAEFGAPKVVPAEEGKVTPVEEGVKPGVLSQPLEAAGIKPEEESFAQSRAVRAASQIGLAGNREVIPARDGEPEIELNNASIPRNVELKTPEDKTAFVKQFRESHPETEKTGMTDEQILATRETGKYEFRSVKGSTEEAAKAEIARREEVGDKGWKVFKRGYGKQAGTYAITRELAVKPEAHYIEENNEGYSTKRGFITRSGKNIPISFQDTHQEMAAQHNLGEDAEGALDRGAILVENSRELAKHMGASRPENNHSYYQVRKQTPATIDRIRTAIAKSNPDIDHYSVDFTDGITKNQMTRGEALRWLDSLANEKTTTAAASMYDENNPTYDVVERANFKKIGLDLEDDGTLTVRIPKGYDQSRIPALLKNDPIHLWLKNKMDAYKAYNPPSGALPRVVKQVAHEMAHALIAYENEVPVNRVEKTPTGAMTFFDSKALSDRSYVEPGKVSDLMTSLSGRKAAHMSTLVAGGLAEKELGYNPEMGNNWNPDIRGSDRWNFNHICRSLFIPDNMWNDLWNYHVTKAQGVLNKYPDFIKHAADFAKERGKVDMNHDEIYDFLEKETGRKSPMRNPSLGNIPGGEESVAHSIFKSSETKDIDPERAAKWINQVIERSNKKSPGATVDPRNGKDMAGSGQHAFSIYPDRTLITANRPTIAELQKFMEKNRNILSDSRNHLGVFRDNDSGKWYTDITSLSKDLNFAKYAATKHNQMSIATLGKNVTFTDTGGTGAYKGNENYAPVATRLDQTLTDYAKTQPKVASTAIMNKPLQMEPGAGLEDIAKRLNEWSKEAGKPLPSGEYPDQMYTERATAAAVEEARRRLAEDANGQEWYHKTLDEFGTKMESIHPELKDLAQMRLYKAMVSISSASNPPNANVGFADDIYMDYKAKGAISPRTVDEMTGRPRQWSPQTNPRALQVTQQLINERGLDSAMQWLLDKHPLNEVLPYTAESTQRWVRGSIDENGMVNGSLAFGPKVGRFFQNLNGNYDVLTADRWFNRTWNRWMGTLFEKDGSIAEATRGPKELALMQESITRAAKELNMSVAEAQAVLWDYEKELYRRHGHEEPTGDYSQAVDYLRYARYGAGAERSGTLPFTQEVTGGNRVGTEGVPTTNPKGAGGRERLTEAPIEGSSFIKPNGAVEYVKYGHPQWLKEHGYKSYAGALKDGYIRVYNPNRTIMAGATGIQLPELSASTVTRVEKILSRLQTHPHSTIDIEWGGEGGKSVYDHLHYDNLGDAIDGFGKDALRKMMEHRTRAVSESLGSAIPKRRTFSP